MKSQSPHNLPEQPNPLLGRAEELKAAREHLVSQDVRLLTMTGPPGVGKTRLAMAVAQSILEAFPEGIWFIDLAPLRDPTLVASQTASTFGLAEIHGDKTVGSLAAYLRDRRVLLFLDNFEGVLPAATWVGKLLEQTSRLKILVTSRERLRLRWERTILVPPLPLPDLDQLPDVSILAQIPAVALFVQRAAAVDASFTVSPENAPVIATLCHRLDGLPLAIELAAACTDVLSPAEILAKMGDRFRLLGMGALDFPERHQTLKAAIDWSYESLPSVEQQFLRQLAVFSGGFSLAAAERVGESSALGLDGLASLIALVEKGLVNRIRRASGETRFTLLESIREYLLETLRASGEFNAAHKRHAGYYLELAERTYSEMKRANQKAGFDVLETEHDNLRAALQWSLESGASSLGERISAASWNFWWLRGHIREGVFWLETFLQSDGDRHGEIHTRLLEGAGTLRGWQKDYERGRELLMQALQMAEERQDQGGVARILGRLGWIFWINGKTSESTWLAEKIKTCPPDVDPWDLAHAYLSLGNLLYEAGQDVLSENAYHRSLEFFQHAQEKHGAVYVESKLALLEQKKGNVLQAQREMVGALEAVRQSIDLYVVAYCVDNAAQLAAQQMAERKTVGEPDLEKLARLFGAVDRWREILIMIRTPRENSYHLQMIENLRRRMGESSYLRAWKEGRSMPIERVIGKAIELLEISDQVQSKDKRVETGTRSTVLSERERQVIGLVAEGLSNQEIGASLTITERTVRFHITSIFNKLGADNRAQAVAIANRLGLL